MNVHAEVIEHLSALLEAELPPEEIREIESHLAGCAECSGHLQRLRQTTELLANLPPHPAPPDLEARVRRKLRRRAQVVALHPSVWPQELLSAAVLAVIIGATVTLSGRVLVSPTGENSVSEGSAAAGLFGEQAPDAVEVRFAAGDEPAARAMIAAAADLGARTTTGLPLRPGEPLARTEMIFTLRKEALSVIVPDGIATVVTLPGPTHEGGGEGGTALPPPTPGWMLVRIRVGAPLDSALP